jgi:UDP-glucose 4-epimerase
MKIGILGANGFIGSHVYGSFKNIHDCEAFDRKKYDIFNIGSMEPFIKDKDIILNLAGSNRASNEELFRVNSLGTVNLLEAIRKFSNGHVKLVFSSSLQVYGLSQDLKLFKEQAVPKPINVYGLSKLFAEDMIRKYGEWYGLKGLIYRVSNVYGPGCKPYYNSAIASFIDLAQKGETITINGNGEQSRDFIYISDVVEAFSRSIPYSSKNVATFNICTGKSITINEVINNLRDVMESSPKLEYKISGEPINYLIGDASKASKVLGFKAAVDLKEGLTKTIEQGVCK